MMAVVAISKRLQSVRGYGRQRRGYHRVAGMRARRVWPSVAGFALVCIVAAGCQGGRGNYLNENDKLRSEVLNLKRTVEKLEKNLTMRVAQIETLEQRLDRSADTTNGAPSDIPSAVSVEFDRLSGSVDTDGDGTTDVLRLYVKTLDQHGRFLPAAGPAEAQVVSIRPGQSPQVLVNQSWTAQEFTEAYRTGATGTHFTLELSLPSHVAEAVDQATVKLSFTDALTGVQLSCQEVMEIRQTAP